MTDFGRDTLCIGGRRTGRYVSGKRLLGQRLMHRLTMRKGQLRGGVAEQNAGLYLPGLLGATIDDTMLGTIGPRIKNELEKDQQVYTAAATVEQRKVAGRIAWTITIAVESDVGPFSLVLSVDGVTVDMVFREAA